MASNFKVVSDDLRREGRGGGGGRNPSELTLALLDGKTVEVPLDQALPDKTIRDRTGGAFRLRSVTNEKGTARVLWIEETGVEAEVKPARAAKIIKPAAAKRITRLSQNPTKRK